MTYPEWSFTIDGKNAEIGGWQCGADEFGYDRATGLITEDVARRIKQGSRLVGYVNGRVGWDGRMASNPLVHRGVARIDAVGHQAQAAKYRKRLLYLSQDPSIFNEARSDPHRYTTVVDKVQALVNSGSLAFSTDPGQAMVVDDLNGLVCWAKGSPGGITRYAFDWVVNAINATTNVVLKTYRQTGPGGAGTLIATHSLNASSGSQDNTISSPEDQLFIELRWVAAVIPGVTYYISLRNLRINGIAPGDVFYTHQVISDIAARLGMDTSLIQSSSQNAMPFDHTGGSALDAMAYMAMLDDRPAPFIGGDGTTIWCDYHDWTDRVWTVHLDSDAVPELIRMEDFNEVRVTYPSTGGFDAEVTRTVENQGINDPLAGTGLRNTFDVAIPDPQVNDSLATAVANTYLNYVSSPRLQGRIRIAAARGPGGINDPYGPLPGDTLRIADYGPAESMDLRIATVEWTQDSVAIGIEAEATFGLIGRAALHGFTPEGLPPDPARRTAGLASPPEPTWFDKGAYRAAVKEWKQSRPKVHKKSSPKGKAVTKQERREVKKWKRKRPKPKNFTENY